MSDKDSYVHMYNTIFFDIHILKICRDSQVYTSKYSISCNAYFKTSIRRKEEYFTITNLNTEVFANSKWNRHSLPVG